MIARSLTVASLYCGAGGMDQGFRDAGFEFLWAADSDPWAVASYNRNVGEHAHVVDLGLPKLALPDGWGAPDVVIGGPPCQGFSVHGRRDPADPRSRHVFVFLELVERLAPRAFVMENVKALAVSPRWSGVRGRLARRARAMGYTTEFFLLNAADFGVPQDRERLMLVGIRGGLPLPPTRQTERPKTVGEVLRALPALGASGNDTVCRARVVPAKRPVLRSGPYRGSLLFNGSGRPLELTARAKTLPASMGGNATPIVDQEELEAAGPPWVDWYYRHLEGGGAPVVAAPARLRRLTVQEAAALQGFPARWCLAGPQMAQFRQVGNAVPPNLAQAVAVAVTESLKQSYA